MLEPLRQFICDHCHQVIKSPEQGWIEWYEDGKDHKASKIRIVHHVRFSNVVRLDNKGLNEGCYLIPNASGDHLHNFMANLMANLLYFVDLGLYHDPNYSGPFMPNLREWSEIVRRLTIPYYEEARLYWNEAIQEGMFEDGNEISIYTYDFLKTIVERYGNQSN